MSVSSNLLSSFRQVSSLSKSVINEFAKDIHKNAFFNNKTYLFINSQLVPFSNPNWEMRPEAFAQDMYEQSDLYLVINLINNISSRFNFREENLSNGIIAPYEDAIYNVLTQQI